MIDMTQEQIDAAMRAYQRGWRCPPGKLHYLAVIEMSGTLAELDSMTEDELEEFINGTQ